MIMQLFMKSLERMQSGHYLYEIPQAARHMHAARSLACNSILRTPQSLDGRKPASRLPNIVVPSSIVRYSFQDDLDASLISRRAISSLQKPKSYPVESSSSSTQSSIDDSDTASSGSGSLEGLTVDEIQAHKKAAVQQAFLNGTLGFGFSAGGLVFPYYGKQQPPRAPECVHSRQLHTIIQYPISLVVIACCWLTDIKYIVCEPCCCSTLPIA